MQNIQQNQPFQQTGANAATVARINNLTEAIQSEPHNAVELIAAQIAVEPDSAVKGWLLQFNERFENYLFENKMFLHLDSTGGKACENVECVYCAAYTEAMQDR